MQPIYYSYLLCSTAENTPSIAASLYVAEDT